MSQKKLPLKPRFLSMSSNYHTLSGGQDALSVWLGSSQAYLPVSTSLILAGLKNNQRSYTVGLPKAEPALASHPPKNFSALPSCSE